MHYLDRSTQTVTFLYISGCTVADWRNSPCMPEMVKVPPVCDLTL